MTNVQDIGATNSSTLSPGGTVAVSLTTSTSIFSNTDANTTRYIRVCADKINKNDSIGSITTESNETNNCGGWTSVVVYPALTATCTMTSSGPPTGFTGNYTSRTYTYTVGNAAGGAGTGSYTYCAWAGLTTSRAQLQVPLKNIQPAAPRPPRLRSPLPDSKK